MFFAKDNKILYPGNRELYLYHRADCSSLSDQQGHAVSNRGHSVKINFVYLTAGVSCGLP